MPIRPSPAISRTSSTGKRASRSSSSATGATRSRANERTVSRISSCSEVRSKSTPGGIVDARAGSAVDRAVPADAQRDEDEEDRHGPEDREQVRVLAREGAGRVGARVPEELSRRLRERADRVPLRDRLQDGGQRRGGDERVREEGQREDDQEPELLHRLDRRRDEPEIDADPGHRVREEDHQRHGEEEVADRGMDAPPYDEAA